MPKHEFGIMPNAPKSGKRYDSYAPEKYGCTSIDDIVIGRIAEKLQAIDFYWSTLSVEGKGLAYCGITLIPPSSIGAFLEIIGVEANLCQLKNLLESAQKEDKWVIHFGL
mgnify:CR=1 FL=1